MGVLLSGMVRVTSLMAIPASMSSLSVLDRIVTVISSVLPSSSMRMVAEDSVSFAGVGGVFDFRISAVERVADELQRVSKYAFDGRFHVVIVLSWF